MSEMMRAFRRRHLEGAGGIYELLPIAVPMFLASIFDMLMMFIDRLFLAHVGVIHQAAAMTGGLANWMCVTLFVGIVGYSSALVAQYYGADQKSNCVCTTWQAIRVAFASYPFVLLFDWGISLSPVFAGHSELERGLELCYFWYMGFGSLISLLRFAFSSFFAGIGRTGVVMAANSVALVVNVCANWALIFGHCGFPALGLAGAAIGTLLSGLAMCLVLFLAFCRESRRFDSGDSGGLRRFSGSVFRKLLRYGIPQGLENTLEMTGFLVLMSSFHCYGDDMATATTIAFNWDSVSFQPMVGIQAAVVTLVGQAMGRGRPDIAQRVAHSGFKVSMLYTCTLMLVYLLMPRVLVGMFTPDLPGLDYSTVRRFAVPMLQMGGLYLMTDAMQLVSSGVLRGAGDTLWGMVIATVRDWGMAGIVLGCIHVFELGPIQTWVVFVVSALVFSLPMYLRYRAGHWKSLRIIGQ